MLRIDSNRYRIARSLLMACAPLLMVGCAAASTVDPPAREQAPSPEETREMLEVAENRTEALARELIRIAEAIRIGDTDRVAGFFTNSALVRPLPDAAAEAIPKIKWIRRHGWQASGDTQRMTRREIALTWGGFLDHFTHVEDVALKVEKASFDEVGEAGEAEIRFTLVGRDGQGRREWVRATGSLAVRRVDPDRWAIAMMDLGPLESLVSTKDLFSEVSGPAGVGFHVPPLGPLNSRPFSFYWHGAAAGDVDRDGDIDLFVTADSRNFLYLNDGEGRFREASAQAAVDQTSLIEAAGATSPLFVDVDNDGDSDLFLSMWGRQKLFENRLVPDGKLVFRDISSASGVAVKTNGLSAIAGDINGDGLPEIYVCGYGRFDSPEGGLTAFYRPENGGRNLLFLNLGGGRFREAAKEYGVEDLRWSNAAVFADLDGDGDQDLYVSNDWGDNQLYLNEGDRFREAASEKGASQPGFGMGVSLGDFDNDGDLDLHATYMSSTAGTRILGRVGHNPLLHRDLGTLHSMVGGNRIFENLGGGDYRDISERAGPFFGGWAWGGGFLDIDNDGWQDLHTPNGLWSGKVKEDT